MLGERYTLRLNSHIHHIIVFQERVENLLQQNNHSRCLSKYRFPGTTLNQPGGLAEREDWKYLSVTGI